jgi:hypothetical protein
LDGTNLPSANINLNSNKITNLANPTNNTDAVNKNYIDNSINAKVSKTGDIMTGDLIIKTGSGPVRNVGCDDLSSGSNTFNLLLGNSQNKITYTPSVGPVIMNALNGFTINQNTIGTDVMRIGKGGSDTRVDVYKDVLLNQKFIRDVKDPTQSKDAVTKIYSDLFPYMTATPIMTGEITTINGLTYRVTASSGSLSAVNAFKNVAAASPTCWTANTNLNEHITMQYPYPIAMSGFVILPGNTLLNIPNKDITSWEIHASNDGITYTTVVPTNTTVIPAQSVFQLRSWGSTIPTEYSYWRFVVNQSVTTTTIVMLQWIPLKPDLSLKKCPLGIVPRLNTAVDYRGFLVTASSEAPGFAAFNAFRQEYGPGIEWATNGVTLNFELRIKLPAPVRIWKIGLRGRDSSETFLNWILTVNTNPTGTVFVPILRSTDIVNNVYREYNVDSYGKYQYYRIYVIQATGPNPGLSVFQLFTYDD